MNNKIQSLESIVIGLYKEFNNIEETKKAIYLFIKNDIKDMATELYGTENYVEEIIKEYKKTQYIDDKNIEFTIKANMSKRWVNEFCSLLKYMEYCGNIGHSSLVGFYADGDGDFRPKFEINTVFEKAKELHTENKPELFFDAG